MVLRTGSMTMAAGFNTSNRSYYHHFQGKINKKFFEEAFICPEFACKSHRSRYNA